MCPKVTVEHEQHQREKILQNSRGSRGGVAMNQAPRPVHGR